MTIKENLVQKRIISIDAFRGITIFLMIFVNELASIKNVPQWLGHMPASVDGMTFVDVVFPAFLFIVGMSIPFAFNARLLRKDSPVSIWKHTLKRSWALIVMGVFMVNAEYGYDGSKMLITPALWGFLAYVLPIPIWNKYKASFSKTAKAILQYGAMLMLVALYFLYVQENGTTGMTQKWWGILGLIGWAYLISVIFYWLTNGRLIAIIIFFGICVAANSLNHTDGSFLKEISWLRFITGHLTHATLVSAGLIISLLLFDGKVTTKTHLKVVGFGLLFLVLGYFLRPYFEVSKIRGTPSWTLYSAAICTAAFYLLYLMMEQRKIVRWATFFMPAASNPLLIYILPGIIYYFNLTFGIKILPPYFTEGFPGIVWALLFSVLMLYVVKIANKLHIKLHL